MKLLYDLNFWINWKVRAAFERLGIFFELDPIIPDRFKHPVTVYALTFHWSLSKIKPRYTITSMKTKSRDLQRADGSGS